MRANPGSLLLCLGLPVCAAPTTPPVRLVDQAGAWRLNNGAVELTVDKKQATLTHLAVPGGPELISLGYYDTNAGPGGHKNAGYLRFGRHESAIAEVAHCDDGMVDVAMRTDPARLKPEFHHPLRTELHYVLRRGDPGFYLYWLRWHEPDMPACELGQTRHVIKARREVFDRWQITDTRKGAFPTTEEAEAAKRVYDATSQLPDGRYMTKYANAVAAEDHHLSGLYSSAHDLGLWQINASSEYINGGPTKQNLTVHQAVPYLLHMVQSGHFGGRGIRVEGRWCKVYGPVFFYLRQGGSMSAQWEEARQRVRAEQAKWPYPWVKPLSVPDAYPLRRGTVTGRVRRSDGGSAAGAMVVLGAARPEWQFQGLSYMFWRRVAEDGTFEIPHVRPGQYTLYAYRPGVFGEARRDGVSVTAAAAADVGTVLLSPRSAGQLLWQVGVADRTAAEFRHGDDFRQVYLHKRYADDFPEHVRFVIGESEESRDWNYYQPGSTTWEVVFDLGRGAAPGAVLTVVVAASGYRPAASIEVGLNGQALGTLTLEPGDSALWRLGIYDAYQVRTLGIPPDSLRKGENVLALTLPHPKAWVMYDFVRLEAVE